MKTHARREPAVEPLETRIAPAFVSGIVNLADLAGANGSKFQGANAGNFSGSAVSAAGDVNGDGFGDFVVGEEAFNLGVGAAAVIFGTATGFSANVPLDASFLDGTQGFSITGGGAGDRLGGAVSAAGDVNGDGFDDVIVGARFADGPGAAYVLFGKASGFAAQVSVSSLNGTTGFKISGATAGDRAGTSVSGAGDVNGDGFDDVIVGADGVASSKGAAYLIYGKASGFAANLALSGLTTEGVRLDGVSAGDVAGGAVSGAGDVNADGFDDVIIGAPKAEGGTKGAAYVVFGSAALSSTIALSGLTGGNGFELKGVANNDATGGAVSGAGDVNGDGFADVIVGASKSQGGINRGAAHVVFGHAGAFLNVITLDTLNGVNGFSVFGPAFEDFAGASVSGAGDVNGDGFSDLVIGAPQNGLTVPDVGDAYVIFGHSGTFTPPNLGAPDVTNLVRLHGVSGEVGAGTAVSGAGDVNGDGFADLLVSNPTAGTNAGTSYLVLGGPNGSFIDPTITGGRTATWTDVDGDLVTLKVNKGTLAGGPAGNFKLIKASPTATGAQLLSLTLNPDFADADVSITAKRAGGGDGRVNVGFINASGVDLGKVTVGGDLGRILVGDDVNDFGLKSLTLGSFGLFGGRTADTGAGLSSLVQGAAGPLKVAGDFAAEFRIERAVGTTSGGDLGGVSIGGSLIGGTKAFSGYIATQDRLGAVKVGGDLVGGAGEYSGAIDSGGAFGSLTIGGSMIGGAGADSGAVESTKDFGNVSIHGSLFGRGGKYSASIYSGAKLGNVSVGGSQVGGGGESSAVIQSIKNMGQVRIAGDQVGGDAANTAYIYASSTGADIAGATIGGNARAGAGLFGGGIFAGGKLGPVTIAGDVLGTDTAPYTIQGQGALTGAQSVAISSVKVGGDFTHGLIRAGFDGVDAATNGHAQIGAISVGGDWIASSVTAGLNAKANAPDPSVTFGNGDDVFASGGPTGVVASITSVTIKGAARGSFETGDRYGIVAEQIGSVSIGGAKLALKATPKTGDPANDRAAIHVGTTPDFVVREISRTIPGTPEPPATVAPAGPRSAQPATINLGALTAGTGSTITDLSANNNLPARDAGDVNGDGFDDIILGEIYAPAGGTERGAAYVIFGKAGGLPAALDVATLDGTNGFQLTGAANGDYAGSAVSGLGDVNGDGFDDIIVGASSSFGGGIDRGTAYVIFGRASFAGTAGTLPLASLTAGDGFKIQGTANGEYLGGSVARAGDVNGDGLDDFLVGSAGVTGTQRGKVYVVFGRADFPTTLDVNSLSGTKGFTVEGLNNFDRLEASQGAGDLNGDGRDDVVVSAPGFGAGAGSYVIFGRTSFATGTVDLSTLSGSGGTGFKINAFAIGGAGDVNGDGFADVIAGNQTTGVGGEAYVIFGRASFSAVAGTFNLASLNGDNGFAIKTTTSSARLGNFVAGAGDVNGDGFADVIASANFDPGGGTERGASYVVFGRSDFSSTAGALDVANLDGANGFKMIGGADTDHSGTPVSAAGDVNGDGFADVLVGAQFDFDGSGFDGRGAAYVVYGGPSGEFIDPTFSADFKTATWTDVDGDLVTLKVSKTTGTLDASNFQLLAKSTTDNRAQLLALNLGNEFEGADVSITAKRAGGGDGKVNAGAIRFAVADAGNVTVGGDVGQIDAGDFDAVAPFKSLTVGSLGVFGGRTQDTGGDLRSDIFGPAGAVKVAGDVSEATLFFRNVGPTGSAASITIGGSLIGGKVAASGALAGDVLGPVKIGGDLVGGSGAQSGFIQVSANLVSLTLGGSMLGAAGDFSGAVQSFAGVGNLTIGGSQLGGAGDGSGVIFTAGSIGKISITGDQIGGTGDASGLIFADGGSSNIASVSIGGDARGGDAAFAGGILAGGSLGPVSIKGDVTGTADHAFTIRGSGPLTGTTSVAIAGVKVGGDFDHALILAGYGNNNTPTNGHAQIGAITVGGDWIASNVIAGLQSSPTATALVGIFGDGDDTFINAGPAGVVASIASITIKGRAIGTFEVDAGFGILAESIGSVKIGGVKLALTSGTDPVIHVGPTPDFIVREVARF